MIEGIGCDIVSIERMRLLYKKFKNKLIKRLLTPRERMQIVCNNENRIIHYLAKRFAAKEAYIKAKGGIGFQDIEVLNNAKGKPYFNNATNNIFLSISDEMEYAIAYVIVEK